VIARLGHALRNVLRRNQVERELADEIDAHLDLLVEEKVARGVSVTEAYRITRLEVGRLEALKEDIRDVRAGAWLDVVRQDVRFSLRWMRRSLFVTVPSPSHHVAAEGSTTCASSAVRVITISWTTR